MEEMDRLSWIYFAITQAVAKAADTLVNRTQLDPLLKGTSPLQEFALGRALSRPFIKPCDLETIHRLDLLGINY
jgi:hypothetical protein